ncbi:hypothetical protein M0Q50_09395 [bacterium]|jgi:hypothetical protein|nr:hypothetical protein [bacterium]
MKKILILLVAMFATSMVFATQIDSVGTGLSGDKVYNDSKAMFGKVMEGAGKAVETGYDVIVQQQRVIAVQYLLVFIASLSCFFLFVRYYKKSSEGQKNSLFPSIVFCALGLWFGVVLSFHYTEVIQGLVNPDYAAIKDIVEMFNTKTIK